jgi:hypothetical protein
MDLIISACDGPVFSATTLHLLANNLSNSLFLLTLSLLYPSLNSTNSSISFL